MEEPILRYEKIDFLGEGQVNIQRYNFILFIFYSLCVSYKT